MLPDNKLTNFIDPVFKFLKTIPSGRVSTYKLAAEYCHIPNARNVGWVLRQNTKPDEIPCYKIVCTSVRLTNGYKFGGLGKQKKRLIADGIEFDSYGKIKNFKNVLINI